MTGNHSWRLLVGGVAGIGLLAATAVLAQLAPSSTDEVVISTHAPQLVSAPVVSPPGVSHRVTRHGPVRPPSVRLGVRLDGRWLATTAARAGIPDRALAAYARASLASPCPVGWSTLAGIGYVESQHGTSGGRYLLSDGRPDRPIRGPALDGSAGFQEVPSRGGDGWARAVGPMQFLRVTWKRWGTDGDGDGRADPEDLDDAALAAARYLCAAGQDLATGAGWSAAVLSYNHSADYVRQVYDAATAYGARAAR